MVAACGTPAGYQRHIRERKNNPDVVIDDACRLAWNEKCRKSQQNPETKTQHDFLTRTMSTAKTILAQRYPEEFAEILEQERRVEAALLGITRKEDS